MEKKYTVLRVIATLYKIAGVLVALGTVLAVVGVIVGGVTGSQAISDLTGFNSSPIVTFLAVVFTFLGGGLSALGIYAIGEALYLLINLEENTRFTAILLRDRFYPQAQPPQPQMPPQPAAPPPPAQTYPPA